MGGRNTKYDSFDTLQLEKKQDINSSDIKYSMGNKPSNMFRERKRYTNTPYPSSSDKGMMENNILHGYGVRHICNKQLHIGAFINGTLNKGCVICFDKIFIGTFNNRKIHGDECKVVYGDGKVAYGKFINNSLNGEGYIYYKTDKFKYNKKELLKIYNKIKSVDDITKLMECKEHNIPDEKTFLSNKNIVSVGIYKNGKLIEGIKRWRSYIYKGNFVKDFLVGTGKKWSEYGNRKYVGEFNNNRLVKGKVYYNKKLIMDGEFDEKEKLIFGVKYAHLDNGTYRIYDHNDNIINDDNERIIALEHKVTTLSEILDTQQEKIDVLMKYNNSRTLVDGDMLVNDNNNKSLDYLCDK